MAQQRMLPRPSLSLMDDVGLAHPELELSPQPSTSAGRSRPSLSFGGSLDSTESLDNSLDGSFIGGAQEESEATAADVEVEQITATLESPGTPLFRKLPPLPLGGDLPAPTSEDEFGSAYTMLRQIGQGGTARIYEARRRSDGARVAIKKISIARSDANAANAVREAAALRALSSCRNVVMLHEVIALPKHAALVLELCKGGRLGHRGSVRLGHLAT